MEFAWLSTLFANCDPLQMNEFGQLYKRLIAMFFDCHNQVLHKFSSAVLEVHRAGATAEDLNYTSKCSTICVEEINVPYKARVPRFKEKQPLSQDSYRDNHCDGWGSSIMAITHHAVGNNFFVSPSSGDFPANTQ
jgi:hypothetical protein